MAMSTNGLLKWITFHLKLNVSSIFNKFIKFIQGVPTEWSPASNKPNTVDGSYKESKTQYSFILQYKMSSERTNSFTLNIYLNIKFLPPLTILFQENINTEHVQLGAQLQGE